MKKLIGIVSLLALTPLTASAAVSYTRSPATASVEGSAITLTITWGVGDSPDTNPVAIGFQCDQSNVPTSEQPCIDLDLYGYNTYGEVLGTITDADPSDGGSITETFTGLPAGFYQNVGVFFAADGTGATINDEPWVGDTWTMTAASTGLFTLPPATTTFAGLGAWSIETFDSTFPIAYIIAGLFIGSMIVLLIIRTINNASNKALAPRWRTGGSQKNPYTETYYKGKWYKRDPSAHKTDWKHGR